jgi:hypothetical protein
MILHFERHQKCGMYPARPILLFEREIWRGRTAPRTIVSAMRVFRLYA